MFRYMHSKRKSGFTLLELIVVMAVIAILVAMGVPRFIGYTKDAAVTAMQADCKVLEDACMIYNLENDGAWPVLVADNDDTPPVPEEVTWDAEGDLATLLTGVDLYMIDDDLLKDHIRSLKHDYDNFALDTDTGVIYFVGNGGDGVEGRSGDVHFSITDFE